MPTAQHGHPYRYDRPVQRRSDDEIGDLRPTGGDHPIVHLHVGCGGEGLTKRPVSVYQLAALGVMKNQSCAVYSDRRAQLSIKGDEIARLYARELREDFELHLDRADLPVNIVLQGVHLTRHLVLELDVLSVDEGNGGGAG